MNGFLTGLIQAHPKTFVLGAFAAGLALVPVLRVIGWVF